MTEYVLSAVGVKGLDARLEAVGLLDPAMEAAGRAVAAELLRRVPAGARPLALLAGLGPMEEMPWWPPVICWRWVSQ
ncbi:hypothetical protein [Deinococcus radiophilus]|uniref:hypothetical protein n=1 Tax=Deinococcus radiophilus TaxID=32062 RepID=UPI00361F900E